MYNELEHPAVSNAMRTGWPCGREPAGPVCPVCGSECYEVYRSKAGEVFGCDNCVSAVDAWNVGECFE